MIFACIGVRFKGGIPNVNFNETPTYHEIDPKVVAPRRPPRPGDTVLIKTIGMPQVKLVMERLNGDWLKEDKTLSGPICGKASFYDSAESATPWADKEAAQGGLALA